MFTNKITGSDAFTEMPMSAQGLYFQLCMNADDDGFINNPRKIIFSLVEDEKEAKKAMKDYNLLIENRFILVIDKVVVIKHWRMHNTISQNRYHETQYTDEKAKLLLKENGSYSLSSGEPINDTRLAKQEEKACSRLASGSQNKEEKTKKAAEPKKPVVYYPNDSLLDEAFKNYVAMRVKIKKPMTDRAIELAIKKLDKLSGGDTDTAIAILEQSVLNSWQDLYELKGNNRQKVGGVNWDNV